MTPNRADILKRTQQGREKKLALEHLLIAENFASNEMKFIGLEASDKILEKVRLVFPLIQQEAELLSSVNYSFKSSLLLNEVFNQLKVDSLCYVYNSDFNVIGLFLLNARKAFEHCLDIARKDEQNTCFLLDEQFRYSFTINYYDSSDNYNPNRFDIQRKRNIKI